MSRWIGVVAVLGWFAPQVRVARAEHAHGMAMSENHHDDSSELSASISVEAARFDTAFYVGSYQAITPSLAWTYGRLGASATVGVYHLDENGLSNTGLGDAMVSGHAMIFATDGLQTGVALHVMFPTGNEIESLGMGHTMAMPSAWGTWRGHAVTVMASAGYSRALVSLGGAAHNHGPSPLVDPMNVQEMTWSAGADLDVGRGVQIGGRTLGGAPIGTGTTRVIGGGRVAWGTPRISTALEVQAGIAGDPFTIRGVVETALRF